LSTSMRCYLHVVGQVGLLSGESLLVETLLVLRI
jgi:hypothetical protein